MAQFQNMNTVDSMKTLHYSNSEIHIWRMRVAVLWSIILQFLFLFVFILYTNLDLFHPLTWFGNSLSSFLSPAMWIKLLVLIVVIYVQGEVCKKDYVTGPMYHATRFKKIHHVFSLRNVLLLLLHMSIGLTVFWIYSSLTGKSFKSLTRHCTGNEFSNYSNHCLVESNFFLLFGGIWVGIYYFTRNYMIGSRNLSFPLIQQYKFYRVKSALKEHIKCSVKHSVLPTIIFLIIYYIYGGFVRNRFIELLSCRLDSEPIDTFQGLMDVQLIFYFWLFSSIFIISLHTMEFLFNVHLTEHCMFPVSTNSLPVPPGNYLCLPEALKNLSIPIIHHLGYLDLFTLSTKCQPRREEIFVLSHPGGHPHSWNGVFSECTKLIRTFTNDLNQALQKAANTENDTKGTEPKPQVTGFHFHSHGIRKLAYPLNDQDINSIRPPEYQSGVEIAFNFVHSWLNVKLDQLYKKPYIAYLFAESTDSRVNYLFCQCQPVIWAVQSLAFLSAASLNEDRYGIVQKDLPEIICIIVSLKQVLDKVFKQNLIIKKSFANDPFDVQMKYLLRTSVKRSLYKVAATFGPYIKDLRLPTDVEIQMNNFIDFKEV